MLANITFLIFNEKGFFAIIKKMKNQFLRSLFTSSISIAPIILLVLIISWTGLAPIGGTLNYLLLISGGLFLILGLTLFQIGASTGLSKVGELFHARKSARKKHYQYRIRLNQDPFMINYKNDALLKTLPFLV